MFEREKNHKSQTLVASFDNALKYIASNAVYCSPNTLFNKFSCPRSRVPLNFWWNEGGTEQKKER
jgi:hypothetical protein